MLPKSKLLCMERWLSGRRRSPGKRVDGAKPRLEGSNPSLSAIFILGRARREGSGVLNPQSAIAGFNSCPRAFCFQGCFRKVMKKVWSCAAQAHKSRQVREEAAVSESLRVPRGSRTGVNCLNPAWGRSTKVGARPKIIPFFPPSLQKD